MEFKGELITAKADNSRKKKTVSKLYKFTTEINGTLGSVN